MSDWEVQPFKSYDKSIRIKGPIDLELDNDDAGPGVDLIADVLVQILNEHYVAPTAYACNNEDCGEYGGGYFSTELLLQKTCPKCGEELILEKVEP